jgi:hypothetical protein
MTIDRLRTFLGLPYVANNGVKIYSPTVNEVSHVGELDYIVNLALCSFDKERVLLDLFRIDEQLYASVLNENDYDVLTDNPTIVNHICNALAFFVKDEVLYDIKRSVFTCNNTDFVAKDNYEKIAEIISQLNCSVSKNQGSKPTFKNDTAKMKFMKLLELRKKYQKQDENALELKDILSILCNSEGNGISIFNVGELTIYQVYEHFERLNLKESHKRTLPVWANGHLGKDDKLPEWVTKTKL